MALTVNNPTLRVSGNFDTPILSGAIYHQSTFNNLFTEGLSLPPACAWTMKDIDDVQLRQRPDGL